MASYHPAFGASGVSKTVISEDGRVLVLAGSTPQERLASAAELMRGRGGPLGGPKAVLPSDLTDPGLGSTTRSRNSVFTCRFPGCGKQLTSYIGMRSHVKRKHSTWYEQQHTMKQRFSERKDASPAELASVSAGRKGGRGWQGSTAPREEAGGPADPGPCPSRSARRPRASSWSQAEGSSSKSPESEEQGQQKKSRSAVHGAATATRGSKRPMAELESDAELAAKLQREYEQPPKRRTASSSQRSMPTVTLFGKAGEQRSSSPLLSGSDFEWLNDLQLGSLAELSVWWKRAPKIRSLYPAPFDVAAAFFQRKMAQRTFRGEGPELLMLKYSEALHWHQLFFIQSAKLVLHHEPYGGRLGRGSAIGRAFTQCQAAGWQLGDVRVCLQSDGYQCGPWVDWVSEVAAAYVGSGSNASFEEYLGSRKEISPLNGLTGAAFDRAKAQNDKFIAGRRVAAREKLQHAFQSGFKPSFMPSWEAASVQIAAFSPTGTVENPMVIDSSDEEDE